MTIIAKIEGAAARLERAREIIRLGLIYPISGDGEHRCVCKSHSGQQDDNGQIKLYLVGSKGCTCADFRKLSQVNGGWCKHRLAREILLNNGKGGDNDAHHARVVRRSAGQSQPVQGAGSEPVGGSRERRAARA